MTDPLGDRAERLGRDVVGSLVGLALEAAVLAVLVAVLALAGAAVLLVT